eukprot:2252471-Rhodomonas_salina.1
MPSQSSLSVCRGFRDAEQALLRALEHADQEEESSTFKSYCCPTWTATTTTTLQPTEEGALGRAQAKSDPPSWAAELY